MKKLLGLDASYQKLNYLRFTDEKFGGMPLLQIRNFFKSACRSDNRIDLFKDMTRVLEQQNQSSYYTIKAMIFLTMLINEAEGNMLDQLQDTINKTVNILWEKQAHRNAKIIQKRAYSKSGSSYEKTVGWIKDKLSVTKANKHKRSQSTATPVVTDKNQQGIQMQKSIEDILHENIARPYCKYVLKLMSSDLWELLLQQQKKMSMQQIWKVVNLLNSVLEISKSFVHLLRYFKKQTLNMVAVLIKIIDYQLRLLYPIAISSLNFSVNELNEQFIELAGRREEYNYVEKLYELVDRYELRQIKEILRELSIINELIAGIYIGKYTYPIVTSEGITYPQVLREDKRFELIFEILKKVDSNKEKVTRRESRSKEKLMRAASPKHRTVLVHKDQKGSNLAQKRLKIIHSKNNHQLSEDNTEIINATLSVNTANQTTIQCPKQQGQRSTFRQMRLNTTSQGVHLESTNTRRLRL